MTNYEKHFGLSKAPFAAHAAGSDVFVAPQVAAAIAGMKKALATEDSIVSVSGPVGAGKTTIARRALDGIGKNRGVVTIGRIQFGTDEILELLLAGLGVRQLPKSTVHRFATFRRSLQQFAEQDARVFIIVEDAARVGFDALSELEAVTAADAGVSNGANLILLGDDSLNDLLREPKMARLKQRLRSRQKIAAQSQGELLGYLKHSFRLAGKEFDSIFVDGCAETLHSLTDGLPRVVNNLVTATLSTAAEQGLDQIDAGLIERVAIEEFGLTGEHNVKEIQAAIEQVAAAEAVTEPEPLPEPMPEVEPEPVLELPEPEPEPEPEPLPEPEPEPEPVLELPEPEPVVAEVVADEDDEIPELIQDTLPDLQILAPELLPDVEFEIAPAPAPEPVAELVPELVPEPEPEPEPVPEPEPEPEHEPTEYELPILTGVFPPESVPESEPEKISADSAETSDDSGEIPEWERDPTLAQLRPDLDALERAMATAQGGDTSTENSVLAENIANAEAPVPVLAAEPEEDIPEVFPEITLDKQIEEKIAEATEALKQTHIDATAELSDESEASNDGETDVAASVNVEPPVLAVPEAVPPVILPETASKEAAKADQELEKIASDLAKAKTIEDVDDQLAETLFGEEFSMIAAQVAANAPSIATETEVATGTPAGETMGSVALSLEEEEPVDEPVESQPDPSDTSASQRLQVLRDLNHVAPPPGTPPNPETSESIVMSGGGVELPPAAKGESVDSIEDQINVSMTQTLKALNINHVPPITHDDDDDDDDDDEKTGFFGLFRRK